MLTDTSALSHLPPSIDAERRRLADAEVDMAKRQAALEDRRARLRDESASVLQLEASLIELAQENESNVRLLNAKELRLEERLLAAARAEEEVIAGGHRIEDEYREAADSQGAMATTLDDRWRAMEEAGRMAEEQHSIEVGRLRRLQTELEEREAMLREKQRALTHREQAIASWQRRLQTKQAMLGGISRSALDRLVAELAEREAILQMD